MELKQRWFSYVEGKLQKLLTSDMIWGKRTVKAKGAAVVLRLADFVVIEQIGKTISMFEVFVRATKNCLDPFNFIDI